MKHRSTATTETTTTETSTPTTAAPPSTRRTTTRKRARGASSTTPAADRPIPYQPVPEASLGTPTTPVRVPGLVTLEEVAFAGGPEALAVLRDARAALEVAEAKLAGHDPEASAKLAALHDRLRRLARGRASIAAGVCELVAEQLATAAYALGLDTADQREIADDVVVALVGLQGLALLAADLETHVPQKGAA